MKQLILFCVSVMAGVAADVIAHIICKWLDRDK